MKTAATPEAQMRALKTWAVDRMTKGTDTPFAWFQFMKLLEVIDTFLEAGDDAGLRDRLPMPEPRRTPRMKTLPANVVSLEHAMRQRAAE
ncbi:MAG: hypothetical protein HOP13_19240 [Alphaproteobacteria bacterium]|nr:hypothetical protein [Alphaproteobacteria bacterium]